MAKEKEETEIVNGEGKTLWQDDKLLLELTSPQAHAVLSALLSYQPVLKAAQEQMLVYTSQGDRFIKHYDDLAIAMVEMIEILTDVLCARPYKSYTK